MNYLFRQIFYLPPEFSGDVRLGPHVQHKWQKPIDAGNTPSNS